MDNSARDLRSDASAERVREALSKRAYAMSGPHLSGYQLVIGFECLSDAQDAHAAVDLIGREALPSSAAQTDAPDPGTSPKAEAL